MQLQPESRDILRQYKNLINERRKANELNPVTTAQIVDSMCEYLTWQALVYICNQFIIQGGSGKLPDA
ncbi:hypothetical protein RYR39_002944 [Yersinia ruckeri]|uniref:hypothetical protein n=1 Tax=Yersinia sp. J1 TaxID=3424774 RepID=UPI002908D7D1|nr:hypothetical protein [Yersinia ruckeri]ELM3741023.1 hypothetical protein [Yersinia ruckeri]